MLQDFIDFHTNSGKCVHTWVFNCFGFMFYIHIAISNFDIFLYIIDDYLILLLLTLHILILLLGLLIDFYVLSFLWRFSLTYQLLHLPNFSLNQMTNSHHHQNAHRHPVLHPDRRHGPILSQDHRIYNHHHDHV